MFRTPKRSWIALVLSLSMLFVIAGCRGGGGDGDQAGGGGGGGQQGSGPTYTRTGQEGNVTGTIAFNGEAPARARIPMSADPACERTNQNPLSEEVVVNGGKLQNVFIHVTGGQTADGQNITNMRFAAPTEARVLDQHGCHYVPHVVGLQTGQQLSVTNSDPTPHNINVQPRTNRAFNRQQAAGAGPINETFTRAETLIPVKCNQHPWMRAYIGVVSHPFYAVSGENGSYRIEGLPPGTYTIEAWHERFGTKTAQVTVAANGTATADFSFDASSASAELRTGSLRLAPALEIPYIGHSGRH